MIWTTPDGAGIRQGSGRETTIGKQYDWYVYMPGGWDMRVRLWIGKAGLHKSSPLPRCWVI